MDINYASQEFVLQEIKEYILVFYLKPRIFILYKITEFELLGQNVMVVYFDVTILLQMTWS